MNNMVRHQGLEYLRVFCMFFIVLWHFFVHGLITPCLNKVPLHFWAEVINWMISEALIVMASIGVNCFILISGYFLYNREFSINRPIKVWLPTFFYSILFWIVGCCVNEGGYLPIPILGNVYPFVSNYIALVFLSPFLSMIVRGLDKKKAISLIVIGGLINLNFIGVFPYGHVFSGGGSLLWYIYLYITACCIKKFEPWLEIGYRNIIVIFLFLYGYVLGRGVTKYFLKGYFEYSAIDYNSFVFFLSVAVFLFFRNYRSFKSYDVFSRIVIWISPYTFGIYLIHDNPIVRNYLWSWIEPSKYLDSPVFLGIVLSVSVSVFIITAVAEWGRVKIFEICHIEHNMLKVCNLIDNKLLKKITWI